jgi:hypothetical protein
VRATFSAPVQTGLPSSHYCGYRVSFPGAKRRCQRKSTDVASFHLWAFKVSYRENFMVTFTF